MMDLSQLTQKVTDVCLAWPGFSIFSELMQVFPDLDIYLAGGVIRDIILDRQVSAKDFDFFLNGPRVDLALQHLGRYGRLTQGPFGSPRLFIDSNGCDYADVVPIDRFSNGLWPCEDIVDVLNQFDFTGNAIAFDLCSRRFFNPQNGCRDLERRILRAVRLDYPDEPIAAEHPLTRLAVLWFRLVHYAQVLDLEIEAITWDWILSHRAFVAERPVFTQCFFAPQIPDELGNA